MGVPARMLVVLALVAVAGQAETAAAAAASRFVPQDPQFVVARIKQAVPDPALRELIARWRAAPGDGESVALATAFLERAHALREPMYVGRAEAVLAPAVARTSASADARRLYARTLEFRHDFAAAESLLDDLLRGSPRDAAARLQRASVHLVRGDFQAARADCGQLLAQAGLRAEALTCLAEALAGSGELVRARALLAAYPLSDADSPAARGYFFTVRAELHERAGALDRAIADYGAGLSAAPDVDATRAALADALIARRESHQADELLDVERPGLALLVRRVVCASGRERERLRVQATEWLAQEAARGDAPHLRELALLSLETGDYSTALSAARGNFAMQRQLIDVRVLARAAVAANEAPARRELADWLHATGYRDAVTESILAAAAGS